MMMVVGLGNPGRQYEHTRHNVGFMTVDELARRHGATQIAERKGAWTARATIAGRSILLVKPQTFMNVSGEAVGPLWRWHKMDLKDLLVISDDIDLPFGRLRLRPHGSAGGHNGLKSIFAHLGSQDIARLKIGVGRAAGRDAKDHVLAPFSAEERADLPVVLGHAADAVELMLRQGLDAAMNVINPPAGETTKQPQPQTRLASAAAVAGAAPGDGSSGASRGERSSAGNAARGEGATAGPAGDGAPSATGSPVPDKDGGVRATRHLNGQPRRDGQERETHDA